MKLTPMIRHPSAESAITNVQVEAWRTNPGVLTLNYVVADPLGALVVPEPVPMLYRRRDNLWKRTCFEAFILIPGSEAYYELNLSPSGAWAVYHFDRFREGMIDPDLQFVPQLDWVKTDDGFEMRMIMNMHSQMGLPHDGPWRLGLTAVIEDGPDQLSYWALTHPPGVQDFHNAAGWTGEV